MWVNTTISSGGSNSGGSTDGDYLTVAQANALYLKITGGTVTGDLEINGLTTINNNLLVKGGITSYNV